MHPCSDTCRFYRTHPTTSIQLVKTPKWHHASCPNYTGCSVDCLNGVDKGTLADENWHNKNCPNHTSACCMGDEFENDMDEFKKNLDTIFDLVVNGKEQYEIVRDGKPVAVIISYDEYEKMKELFSTNI